MKPHNHPPKDDVAKRPSRLDLVKSGAANPHFLVPETGQKYVDIDSILPDPKNERKNLRDIEKLSASIKAVGIIESPTVTPLGNGQYRLLTGERRWRAAKAAGLKRIHVIVGQPEEERRRRLKSLLSNIQRADLGPIELAQALHALKENHPEIQTNRELAQLIGKSESWTSHMLGILKLPTDMQRQLTEAPQPVAYDVAQEIARINDPETQRRLLTEAVAGATTQNLRRQARELSGKTSPRKRQAALRLRTSQATVTIRHKQSQTGPADHEKALREALTILAEQICKKERSTSGDVGVDRT